ncbi:uncharacterized protein LOC124420656 [Lucilia cuprina]|uniref:uncharacterized protein LOC124420656 n=1 Tax=Lucilia cuprina TaxID=7375 RepID=UPI001F06000A|nr:uncharacterized protein LOC124420656 [Lucilia cuprina]
MKCCSRSTLGVIIGALNIFGFTVAIIYIITLLGGIGSLSEEEKQENEDILTVSSTLLYILLIFCVVSFVTSVLLVLGIFKENHTFMKPWICSAIIGIAFYILRLVIAVFVGFTTGKSFGGILADLVVGLLTLGKLKL